MSKYRKVKFGSVAVNQGFIASDIEDESNDKPTAYTRVPVEFDDRQRPLFNARVVGTDKVAMFYNQEQVYVE